MTPVTVATLLAAPCIGSFIGVVVSRLPSGEKICLGRSRCPTCGHTLAASDLIPIISWIRLRGTCRYCDAPIGWFYPFIEISAVLVVIWAAISVPAEVFVASCVLGWLLLALGVVDWRTYLLPDMLVLWLFLAGLGTTAFLAPDRALDHIIGAVAGFVTLFICAHVYSAIRDRPGLGGGDIKLMGAIGCWLSWVSLPSVIVWAAGGCFALLIVRSGFGAPIRATERIPLGSYLAVGAWITWLYGPLVSGTA